MLKINFRNSPDLPAREEQEKQKYIEKFLQNQSNYNLQPGPGKIDDGLLFNYISE